MKKRTLISLMAAMPLALSPLAFAQEDDDQVFELSPFQVDTSGDSGYRAANTLAGSRLNTSLRDVASSVTPFTEAFIEDLGIQDLEELSDYTPNMTLDFGEDTVGGVLTGREGTTANSTTQRINIRGVAASQGMDYFRSVTPSDGYRIGRYDSARGPNSILFGLSSAGGVVNSSSIGANVNDNSGRIRLSYQDTGGFRQEFRFNRTLIEDKLAIAVAGVNQEYELWQVNTFDDAERIFGTVTYKVNDKLTVRANYESGTQNQSNQTRSPPLDWGGIGMYDWTNYLNANGGDLNLIYGTSELTLARNNGNEGSRWIPAGEEFLGNVQRNTNPRFNNRRYTFTTNDGVIFDDAGNHNWRGYGDARFNAPPDANWENPSSGNGGRPRVSPEMTDLLPRHLNVDGPGSNKDWAFDNYTAFVDYAVNDKFYISLSHNHQKMNLLAYGLSGFNFDIRADGNLTRGLDFSARESFDQQVADGVAPADRVLNDFDGSGGLRNPNFGPNPYVGKWYLESNWQRDQNEQEIDATRLAMSYELDTERWGSHRFALVSSRTEEFTYRRNSRLRFLGRPWNTHWNNGGNGIQTRTYFDFNDPVDNPESFHIGHWNQVVGKTFNIDGQELTAGWTRLIPGGGNKAGDQTIDSHMFVMTNHWLNRKLVTTVGLRKDSSDILQFFNDWSGNRDISAEIHTEEELLSGPLPDFENRDLGDQFDFDSDTKVVGAVYHINDNFSLLANVSDSIGFPDFNGTQIPFGNPSPPPHGEGVDYGIQFSLLDNRFSGRLVAYETEELDALTGANTGHHDRFTDLAMNVVDEGILTQAEWDAEDAQFLYSRTWNRDTVDKFSKGIELTVNANVTENWRMTFNASKIDRVSTNIRKGSEAHYGMLPDTNSPLEWDLVINPFAGAEDNYHLTMPISEAFTPDGVYSKMIGHIQSLMGTPTAGDATRWEDITTTGSRTAGREFHEQIKQLNDNRELNHKRWGLRPYRVNWWNAYDFTEGALNNLSVGAGISWQDNMIMGENSETLEEFTSRELWNTDAMIRYRWPEGIGALEGPLTLQLNISNVLDDTDIIPVSHQERSGPITYYPYNRGIIYSRYDVPQGRSWRLTATYEF